MAYIVSLNLVSIIIYNIYQKLQLNLICRFRHNLPNLLWIIHTIICMLKDWSNFNKSWMGPFCRPIKENWTLFYFSSLLTPFIFQAPKQRYKSSIHVTLHSCIWFYCALKREKEKWEQREEQKKRRISVWERENKR